MTCWLTGGTQCDSLEHTSLGLSGKEETSFGLISVVSFACVIGHPKILFLRSDFLHHPTNLLAIWIGNSTKFCLHHFRIPFRPLILVGLLSIEL